MSGLRGVSVVIPTYDERDNIGPLVRQIDAALGARKHEILVVDDRSPDGTGEAVLELAKEVPGLRLLVKEERRGIGAALREGYDAASGDVILSIDADLSFSPADIPRLLAAVDSGADLALGCRHMAGSSYESPNLRVRLKLLFSRGGNLAVRRLTGLSVRDYSGNFRAIRRDVWRRLDTREDTNSMLLEMILKAHWNGFRIEEIPVAFVDRVRGVSKLDLALEAPKYLVKLIKFTAQHWLSRFR